MTAHTRKNGRVFIEGILLLPIIWGIFQTYHVFFSKPIAEWFVEALPGIFCHIDAAYPFAVGLLHLLIWGTMALIWPKTGFGDIREPDLYQRITVIVLVSVCMVSPVLMSSPGRAEAFKEMGFVVWTITPVSEEILFRGFLYTLLLRVFHVTPDSSWKDTLPVLLFGGLWFSLWHLVPSAVANHGWGLVGPQLVITFFAGIIFSGLRHWTGSIWLCIPIHAAGNFMASFL